MPPKRPANASKGVTARNASKRARSSTKATQASQDPSRSRPRSREGEEAANMSRSSKTSKRTRAGSPTTGGRQPKRLNATETLNRAPAQRLNIYVFGRNASGELGLGPSAGTDDVAHPLPNPNLAAESVGIVQLDVGGKHCAALTHDNRVLTWGANDLEALGRDTAWDGGMGGVSDAKDGINAKVNPKQSTPGEVDMSGVPQGTVFTQVAASDNATFALTSQGLVYGWGAMRSLEGIAGFAENGQVQRMPTLVPALERVIKIAAADNHVLALTAAGTVYTWGSGERGQLGRHLQGRRKSGRLVPKLDPSIDADLVSSLVPHKLSLKDIVDIGVGADYSFAIGKDGSVYSWGDNSFGQTGIGIDNDAAGRLGYIFNSTLVESLKDLGKFVHIAGGNKHTVATTSDGDCFAWGDASDFATGLKLDNLPSDRVIRNNGRTLAKPTRIPELKATLTASGGDHSIAITPDHRVFSWGSNNSHQTGHEGDDAIKTPTLLDHPSLREKEFVWVGAGGQFTLLAEEAGGDLSSIPEHTEPIATRSPLKSPPRATKTPQESSAKKPRGNKKSAATKKAAEKKDTAQATGPNGSSSAPGGKQYWLMKAEPETRMEKGVDVRFSIDDLAARTEPEPWDGIRAYAARNNLRAMKKGDLAFFYHSNCKEPAIVGTMEVVQEHSPDLTAHDPKAPYYDPSSKPSDPKWSVVHVEFRSKFAVPIGLKELRTLGTPGKPLENMQMLKQSRLSVSKVSPGEWEFLNNLAQEKKDG